MKVGQIESGLPKTGISELSATKITRYESDSTNATYSDHASLVAAIIAGNTGMAPQAELTTGTKTIAIAWLKRNSGTGTNHEEVPDTNPIAGYSLRVTDSSGNYVAGYSTYTGSVEMVKFDAKTTSKYTVEITRISSGNSTETISLAHVRD